MRLIRLVAGLLLTASLFGCVKSADEDEVAVYYALLKHLGVNDSQKLLIRDKSINYAEFERQVGNLTYDEIDADINTEIESFRERNATYVKLSPSLDSRHEQIRYITVATINEMFPREDVVKDPWGDFYKDNPGYRGWLSISRPGYNNNLSSALVYYEIYCGPSCADGTLVYLQRKNDVWQVQFTHKQW